MSIAIRTILTMLTLLGTVISLGVAFLAAMDPEGRGGKVILSGLALAALCILANIPIWVLFQH